MAVERIMKSDDVRQNWRDVIDDALLGGRVIIERYTKPLAVIINYKQYVEMKERLSYLETWAEAQRIKHAIDSGSAQVVTFEQHKANMGNLYDLDARVQPGS